MASLIFIGMLLIAIAVNGAWHKNPDRVMVCLILLICSGIHFAAFDGAHGLEYYGSAAILHLVINWFLDRFDNTFFASDILIINYLGLLGQCFGFICYVADISQLPYNALMIGLAVVEMLRLLIKTGRDKEDDERRDYYRRHGVYSDHLGSNATGNKGG